MSFPLDLSVTGKATPRVQKESYRRPLSANRAKSTSSNIFGVEERPKSIPSGEKRKEGVQTGLPPRAGVVSRSQHEAIKNITSSARGSTPTSSETEKSNRVERQNNRKAPEGVPRLQLQGVIDADEKTNFKVPVGKADVGTPSSRTASRRTPQSSSRRPPSGKKTRGGGWQVSQNRKLADSPGSSGRKKHEDVPTLDLQLSQSNEGLRDLAKTAKIVREDLNIEYIGVAKYRQAHLAESLQKREQTSAEPQDTTDSEKERQTGVYKTPESREQQVEEKPVGNSEEKLRQDKKSQFVEETLLLDQLARVAMEDEEFVTEERSYQNGLPDPKARRHMDLFHSSHRSHSASSSGTSLVKRLRFGARILTRNGHDALREISGFFFPADSTLTMYEFRQFGTRSSALPFIQRGCYPRLFGPREDEPYNLADIDVGKTLHFATKCHTCLPANLITFPVISFRISDVDRASREDLLYEGCFGPKDRVDRDKWIAGYTSEEERTTQAYLEQVQEVLREKLRKRATKTLTNIGKHFRKLKNQQKKPLELEDLRTTLKVYRLELPDEDVDAVWQIVHNKAVQSVDYVDMMQALTGEMSEQRKAFVRKAFVRLDPSKTGVVKVAVLKKFFSAKKHPAVLEGLSSESSILADFLSHFDNSGKDSEISFKEFEEYYEGVSIDCPSNQEFAMLMKTTWGV